MKYFIIANILVKKVWVVDFSEGEVFFRGRNSLFVVRAVRNDDKACDSLTSLGK